MPQVSLLGPAQARLGSDTQYRALINGAIATKVAWSVDGVVGGSSSTGLISVTGVYLPAGTVWSGRSVTISATTKLNPSSSASMTVRVLNPLPSLASGSVTQTAPGASFLLDTHGSGFVSASRLLVSGAEVTTIFVSPTELRSTIVLPHGTTAVNVGVVNPHAEQRTPADLTLPVQAAASAAALSGFGCSSASMGGSGSNVCTVTLNTAAPSGGLSVSLASSNAAVAVPGTILVPANAISASFVASVSPITVAQSVTLTATGGSVARSFPLQLTASVPTLAISPASVAFGNNQALNTPLTEPVTLTSTGTAPVTISAGKLSGTGFTMSGATFPITLNPGLAVTLDVQFDPTAAGPATGQLIITSNSSTNPTVTVSLSGTGASVIAVSTSPATASVNAGSAQQFAASVTGTSNTAVVWTVSGTGCIGAACGTISASGLYTAPDVVPVPATVIVTGTSEAEDTKSATSVVTIGKNTGATYYLAPAADGGSDSNSGSSPSAPWLTPKHTLNCGDVISAAPGTYAAQNFSGGHWGTVNCPAGNNVAWLQCATFDTCKITSASSDGIWVDQDYWGVTGWESSTNTTSYGACFRATPSGNYVLHHVIFANDIANGCMGGGFVSYNTSTSAGTDYLTLIGNIAYNAAQASGNCFSGISIYQPIASDSVAGTHEFIAGNFSFGNVDPNPCAGGPPTDGEAVIIDTPDFSQGGGTPYTQQIVVENNVGVFNGGRGFEIYNNQKGATHATIYFKHNTAYGDMTDNNQTNGCYDRAELALQSADNVTYDHNLAETRTGTSCSSVALSALTILLGNATDTATNNWLYSPSGNSDLINSSTGFVLGAGNTMGTNPEFSNPVKPGAPSCGSFSNVPACMAAVISDYTATVPAAQAYGYQAPAATSAYDPIYPQWLCNVNLPSGLVTAGCQPQP